MLVPMALTRKEHGTRIDLRISQVLKARLELASGSRRMSDFVREAIEEKLARMQPAVKPKIAGARPVRQLSAEDLAGKL